MSNKATMNIREGLVCMDGWGDTTHTARHKTKYRINQWCFHYVTIVFGVSSGPLFFFWQWGLDGPQSVYITLRRLSMSIYCREQ